MIRKEVESLWLDTGPERQARFPPVYSGHTQSALSQFTENISVQVVESGDFMQRRFTERRVSANVEWCFVIGQCHGNSAPFDVGVDATFSETLQKVPSRSLSSSRVPCASSERRGVWG